MIYFNTSLQRITPYYDHYIRPTIDNPSIQRILAISQEIFMLVGTYYFLKSSCSFICWQMSEINSKKVYGTVVLTPFIEEILFREFMLDGIKVGQSLFNKFRKKILTEADRKAQQSFRIYATGVIFGLVHLYNSDSISRRIVTCIISCHGGIAYGWLRERYNSIAIPILAHGLFNMTCYFKLGLFASKLELKNDFALVSIHLIEIVTHNILINSFWYSLGTGKLKQNFCYYVQGRYNHPTVRKVYLCIKEIFLISLSVGCLGLLTDQLVKRQQQFSYEKMEEIIVIHSIALQLINLAIIKTLKWGCEAYCQIRSIPMTDQMKEKQNKISTHLAALYSAIEGYLDSDLQPSNKLLRFGVNYFAAFSGSYLREKYKTVSLPILSQGLQTVLLMSLC